MISVHMVFTSRNSDSCSDVLDHAAQTVLDWSTMDPAAVEAFEVIEKEIGGFLEQSKIVMTVLDDIGTIHPFVQGVCDVNFFGSHKQNDQCYPMLFAVAVAAFKIAISLEIARNENDRKVLALKIKMKDMMCTLYMYVARRSPQLLVLMVL